MSTYEGVRTSFTLFSRSHAAVLRGIAIMALLLGLFPLIAGAQDCNNLVVSGDSTGHTDWNNINGCLNGASHSATLGIGRFYIYQQLEFPQVSGTKLLGSGNTTAGSVIEPVYASVDCSPLPSCFLTDSGNSQAPFRYKWIIWSRGAANVQISNFMLDLNQLRRSYNHFGDFAIQIGSGSRPSPGTQITSLRIIGSQSTTGWANSAGIRITNSLNCVVADNVLKDFGYMREVVGIGAAGEGIAINNSGSALVQNNTVTRVSFGIEVFNNANEPGDSSGTTVSGNSITGTTTLTCTDCSAGRAMKLVAEGGALPLRYLTVQNNTANNWGGESSLTTFPTGLYLLGVQYSTITGNVFDGSTDTRANWGLEVHSSFQGGPAQATHHNTISGNTFRAGPCGSCGFFDVKFADDGPDQGLTSLGGIRDLGRGPTNGGNNTFNTMSWTPGPNRGCSQFAHAFFAYPTGQNFVNRGQSITLAAAGIRPDASFPITFHFYGPSGNLVSTVPYPGGNSNCVMNERTFLISSGVFVTPGLYKVLATYNDGNSNAQIVDDWIGTGGQQVLLDVRDSGCTPTLNQSSASFAGNGGNGTVDVSATIGCNWTATTNSPFITITSGSGTGNGTVSYSVVANPDSTIRNGTIAVNNQTFTVYQGVNFADVPSNHPFYTEIGKISARSVTVGCGGGNFCPDGSVLRQEMAAFIVKAGGELDPPVPPTQRFTDVPPANVFYNFIDRLAVLQITLGCTADHLTYCPGDTVPHEQMAAFMLRAIGEFSPPTPPAQRFSDVPPANVFYNFIDQMFLRDIWQGCSTSPLWYCPAAPVKRAEMAHILVKAFNL